MKFNETYFVTEIRGHVVECCVDVAEDFSEVRENVYTGLEYSVYGDTEITTKDILEAAEWEFVTNKPFNVEEQVEGLKTINNLWGVDV